MVRTENESLNQLSQGNLIRIKTTGGYSGYLTLGSIEDVLDFDLVVFDEDGTVWITEQISIETGQTADFDGDG